MRFEVSRVLDAIERRLSTDPEVAGAIVDVGQIARATDLDGGRPAYLPRLGLVIDALGRHLGDAAVPVYPVAERALLSDLELTSNEKMVLRRWADDGLVEVVPTLADRLVELATLTGLPVVTRATIPVPALAPVAGVGGAALIERPGTPPSAGDSRAVLDRNWQCPEPGCEAFGRGRSAGQPVPRLVRGRPTCPRHERALADAGPRPRTVAVTAWLGGVARTRFAVGDRAVAVGRSPDEPGSVQLGPWLDDDAVHWVSRSHVELALDGATLTVTDRSTNGTTVRPGGGGEPKPLTRGQLHALADTDVVELYRGVELVRTGQRPPDAVADDAGVMAEAPTVAMRVPGN